MAKAEYQELKPFQNFQRFLVRKKIPNAKKWASLIFDNFFDPSLAFPDLDKSFSIRAKMIFPKSGPFAITRDELGKLGVLATHRKHDHDKHKLGIKAKKYLKQAYDANSGMENDKMKIISQLETELADLHIELKHEKESKKDLIMWHDEKVEAIFEEMRDFKAQIMEMLGPRLTEDEKEEIEERHLKLVKNEDIS